MRELMQTKKGKQHGAVMITALMILLLMTIFGISTMDTNILEEKMAGNMRDRNVAFQAAEAALRAGEGEVASWTVLPDLRDVNDATDTSRLWDLKSLDPVTNNNIPWWGESTRQLSWWKANAVVLDGNEFDTVAGLSADHQPAFIIEKLPPRAGSLEAAKSLEGADVFVQVTARGIGQSENTVVILQTVYKW